ncbi:MAG: hypothetical protein IKO32_02620 [Lachnospiraceae bacterium]|nr:hypothetical protein [Lachnospiraceae bacterium]
MKKRTRNKLLAVLAITLIAALVFVPVVRTRAVPNYSAIPGGATSLDKYLVLPTNLSVPGLTFSFSVTPISGDKSATIPVYDGDESGKVELADSNKDYATVADAVFVAGENTTPGSASDPVVKDTTKHYAKKTVAINFSNTLFREPGIYRYKVTETAQSSTTPIGGLERILDVYVQDNGSGELEIQGYVMYADESGVLNKKDYFENQYPSHNLYIGKKIYGNQASKDKYFRFEVTLKEAGANTTVNVGGDYTSVISTSVNGATTIDKNDLANPTDTSYTNPSSFTTDASKEATVVFYLQGDQYVNLMGLPESTIYSVQETNDDGYTSESADVHNFEIGTEKFDDSVNGTVGTENIYTGFYNTKEGTIPTGVILSVAPWAIAGVVILAGVIFFAIRSRRRFEEE